MYILGFDIGGTKCAVITANWENEKITLIEKRKIPTDLSISPEKMIEKLIALADEILDKKPEKIGISCGGPLSSEKGIIMSPPNLKGWDNVEIVKIINEHYGVETNLQNDANACAVAEWKFGAGVGAKNLVFMTFGTGLGAGIILDGRLYVGTNDNAGEVGHVRLENDGPEGYGKRGSFEGFCSGGGIKQLGIMLARNKIQSGVYPEYMQKGMTDAEVSAKTIADAARKGDETAVEVFDICAKKLGKGLSIIIDILNPEVIVIGSVFARCHDLLWEKAKKIIDEEALSCASSCCKVVPAVLGENIGDYAAVAAALI